MNNKFIYKNKIPKSLKKKKPTIYQKTKKQDHLPRGHERAKWPLPSLIGIGSLLIVILIIPTLVVIPFMKPDHNSMAIVEKDPTVHLEMGGNSISVSVMRTNANEVEEVPLETYVARVVASEMPTEFELEALKAQGLAARTYIVNHLLHQNNAEITDAVDHQVYKNEAELRKLWGENFHHNMSKLTEAVAATEGEILSYNNAPITAAYFSTGNGYTENSEDYWDQELPYLRSVASPWDEESPKFLDQRVFAIDEVEQALDITIGNSDEIELSRTESNRVNQVKIAGNTFTGREIREKLSLQSSDFTIKKNNEHFVFTTKGFGHGIGMSQYGANGMAKEGKTYKEIVQYYYQDIEISKITEIAPTLVTK